MMDGYGMMAAGWAWMVGGWAVLVLAILGGAWLISRSIRNGRPPRETPLDILQQRFARGEIGQSDYEKAREALR